MKKVTLFILGLLFAVSVQAQTAEEIVRKSEDFYKGKSSVGTFTMKIVTPEFKRTLKMDAWNDGNENALIIIKSPKKEAGNKTLKKGKELWMYLKNTEMTMKMPASMLLQSWNGSDLTNDDLVRESDMVDDYELKMIGSEKIGGVDNWKIQLKPRPDAPVVWGKIIYWVRKTDNLPSKIQYFDERGTLHRTMEFHKIKKMGGRTIPTVWKIISNKKKNHYTEFIYNKVKFDTKIPKRIFSYRELER